MGENSTYKIHFSQGSEKIEIEDVLKESEDVLERIKNKISELFNIKNVNFLFGAGTSADSIPCMQTMEEEIHKKIQEEYKAYILLYESINTLNLETKLNVLYSKKHYLEGTDLSNISEKKEVEELISIIEMTMYKNINIDLSIETKSLELYKKFYQKTAFRNKDLSRLNIFTTNNDLINEKALDTLNINFNNGFGGGLDRVFNPARFSHTLSRKIDSNLSKYEPIENMLYLYKLHGSISWIKNSGNSLFNIKEVSVKQGEEKDRYNHVLIYPTPLKQGQSLGAPYADLIREFQTKLLLPQSVLFIIGYSFSDEHINDIIYQALASNSSISIVIFGNYSSCPLISIKDNRVINIFGTMSDNRNIHYFEYIVEELLPNIDENRDKQMLQSFISELEKIQKR